jgi:hypothetical protein
MTFMKSVTAFAGQVVEDRVTRDAGAVKHVGDKSLMLSLENNFKLFKRAKVEIFHDARDSS